MRIDFNTIVSRALMAGAAVGILLGGYLYFVVEPTVDEAIELESALAPDGAAPEEEPLFTRDEQVRGGVAANIVFALIVSAIFGIVYARFRHRLPGSSNLTKSLWLAAVAFGTVGLIPGIKYPANPPAVGDPDTVGQRTVQWIVLVVVSVLAAAAVTRTAGILQTRLDRPTRYLAIAVVTVVVYAVVLILAPATPDGIAPEVPAALVWDFRLRSLGGLALLWGGIGLVFGWLLARATGEAGSARSGARVAVET